MTFITILITDFLDICFIIKIKIRKKVSLIIAAAFMLSAYGFAQEPHKKEEKKEEKKEHKKEESKEKKEEKKEEKKDHHKKEEPKK